MPSPLIVPGGRPTAEQLAAEPDPTLPPEPIECATAFVVYQVPEDGEWRLATIDADLVVLRALTPDDLTAGCANLLSGRGPHTFYHPDEPTEVVTLFVLFQLPNGLWQVADKIDAPLVPGREPNRGDVIGACAVTMRDAQTREVAQLVIPQVAEAVVARQFQIGQAIREQAESAKVQQQLEADERRRAGRR